MHADPEDLFRDAEQPTRVVTKTGRIKFRRDGASFTRKSIVRRAHDDVSLVAEAVTVITHP